MFSFGFFKCFLAGINFRVLCSRLACSGGNRELPVFFKHFDSVSKTGCDVYLLKPESIHMYFIMACCPGCGHSNSL